MRPFHIVTARLTVAGLVLLDISAGVARAADFAYGVEAPARVIGEPGRPTTFEAWLTMTTGNNPRPAGAESWSLSIFAEGGEITEISLKGVVVSTIFNHDSDWSTPSLDPYLFDLNDSDLHMASLVTRQVTPQGERPRKGAVSVAVLKTTEWMRLQPVGTARIARIRVSATIPEEGCGEVTLVYDDGGRLECCPRTTNGITFDARTELPALSATRVTLCPSAVFRRGDSNADGRVDVSDPVFTLHYAYLGGPAPPCLEAADANDDGGLNVTDAIDVLGRLFIYGHLEDLPPPGPYRCGADPRSEGLSCDSSPACP